VIRRPACGSQTPTTLRLQKAGATQRGRGPTPPKPSGGHTCNRMKTDYRETTLECTDPPHDRHTGLGHTNEHTREDTHTWTHTHKHTHTHSHTVRKTHGDIQQSQAAPEAAGFSSLPGSPSGREQPHGTQAGGTWRRQQGQLSSRRTPTASGQA